MDLVISIDTSAAHLSGAMGKPTWVLLPHLPDWRWLLDRSDSPWYPSMRLYRQEDAGVWDSVLQTVTDELGQLFPPSID
jgi:ADP-heptose:LPS heptosyltransferase